MIQPPVDGFAVSPDEFFSIEGNITTFEPAPKEPDQRFGNLLVRTSGDALLAAERTPLVKGLIAEAEFSVWIGKPGSAKTFVSLHIAYAIAQGRSIIGRRVTRARVLYVSLEGEGAFEKRIKAMAAEYKEAEGFFYIAQSMDLFADNEALDNLIEAAIELGISHIVIDTLNRALGGGSENDPGDMGRFIGRMDRLRRDTGAQVAIVHHVGKESGRGPRGHSALEGAADLIVEITNADGMEKRAEITKCKDDASGWAFGFKLRVVELGLDADGDSITTCVVDEIENSARGRKNPKKATAKEQAWLDCIKDLMTTTKNAPVVIEANMPPVVCLTRDEIYRHAVHHGLLEMPDENPDKHADTTRGGRKPANHRQDMSDYLIKLAGKGFILMRNHCVWLPK